MIDSKKVARYVIGNVMKMADFVVKDNKLFLKGLKGKEIRETYESGPIKEIVRRIESYDSEKEELIVSEKVALRKPAEFVTMNFCVRELEDD